MKEFNDFLTEKKKESKKDKPLKKGAGADDKQYMALMGEYKALRRNDASRRESVEVLEKAFELAKKGDVSEKAKVAAAYL